MALPANYKNVLAFAFVNSCKFFLPHHEVCRIAESLPMQVYMALRGSTTDARHTTQLKISCHQSLARHTVVTVPGGTYSKHKSLVTSEVSKH